MPHHALSRREAECLQSVADGFGDRQTAGKLNISERTVRFHIENAIKKLDARNRAHAIALAVRSGLLEVNPT